MKKVLTIIFAGLASVGLASAAITPALVNVTGSSPYTWNYEISVDGLENLVAGNYFTIYDFAGYAGTACTEGTCGATITAPAGWSDSVQLLGITPSMQAPFDSGTLENLTFYYTGAGITGPTASDITGFSAESSFGTVTGPNGTFTYQATNKMTGLDQGIGPIEVPTATPEPVTTGLIGLALVGMAVARRKFAR